MCERLGVRVSGAVGSVQGGMRFRPVLVEFQGALPVDHVKLKRCNRLQHLGGVGRVQTTPLCSVGRLMLADEGFEQRILVASALQQARLNAAVHRQIVPAGNPLQFGVHRWRQVRLRPQKSDQCLRPCLEEAPVRVGAGTVAQQHQACALLPTIACTVARTVARISACVGLQRKVRDHGKSLIVGRYKARQRVRAHHREGMLQTGRAELGGLVHGARRLRLERHASGRPIKGALILTARTASAYRSHIAASQAVLPQNLYMALHFIANAFVASASGRTIDVVDPSDGRVYDHIQRGNAQDIDAAVRAARHCFEANWRTLAAADRGRLLMRLSAAITEHAGELAAIEQRDCGKPVRQARADAVALARYFEFYAGACDKLHGETLPYQHGTSVLTWREAHGVTGHVIPWNYPMQIFGRSVGGALAAGNACVVKPSEDACLSLLRVAELAAEVGFPPGAINIVTGYGHEVGDALARHAGIDHISFTGSPVVGTLIAQAAAERHCPVTLELGGKSPQVVFADADLEAALPAIVNAIVQNGGQTCSAGSRLLVDRALYEPLLERLGPLFAALRAGPAAMDLDVGPLIRATQQQRVQRFLEDARVAGISTVAQGSVVAQAPTDGFYAAPVLLRDVPADHRLAQEEIFGPVLCAMPFDDEDHAVHLANGTPFGLAAGVWTQDGGRQLRMARRLQCGQVFVNNYGAGGGVELPFGGVKSSGYGREKGFEALYGFTTLKTVAIRHG